MKGKQNRKSPPILATFFILTTGAFLAVFSLIFKENLPQRQMEMGRNMTNPMMKNRSYGNGLYYVSQTYDSPGGKEKFDLSITLEDKVVTLAGFKYYPAGIIGENFLSGFNNKFRNYVVGKHIDEIQVQVISGASLTSKAFFEAIEKVKSEAVNS